MRTGGLVLPALRRSMRRLFRAYAKVDRRQEPLLDVFLFEDVMVNSIYADGLRALAVMLVVFNHAGVAWLPGGFVGVHTGLILATQNEAELASVLAHEITHMRSGDNCYVPRATSPANYP